MTSWGEVRRALLVDYRPNALDRMSGQASRAAENLWHEITAVEQIQAWRSTTALAGQLLELLLKQAVINAGGPARIAKRPLGDVIDEAEHLGIFAPPTNALTVASSVYAAKELRNIASHGGPWQDDDTEQRATYSLVYLICFSGYLFPRVDIPLQEQVSSMEVASDVLDGDAEVPGDITQQPIALAYDELALRVRSCSPRSLLRLARAEDVDLQRLVTAFTKNFGYVIENAGYGRVRSLFELARWCQDVGLSAHARSCGILLPHDAEALEWLGRQNPLTFVKYLYECRRSEPRLFNRRFNRGSADAVMGVARSWLSRTDVNVTNIANLLYNIPTGTLIRFLDENHHQIAERLKSSPAVAGVAWLPPLARADRTQARARDEIVSALLDALTTDDDTIAAAIPVRLAHLNVIDNPIAAPLVNQLLHRVTNGMNSEEAVRVLWDLYAMSETHAQRAVNVAQAMFPQTCTTASPWVALLWASIILAYGGSVDGLDRHLDFSSLEWPPGKERLVQQLRVGFVMAKLDVPLAPSRARHLGRLARDFVLRSSSSYANSRKFIAECVQLFPS